MKNGQLLYLKLSNYYGQVNIIKRDDEYYMTLEDWSGIGEVKISEKLAKLLIKEFSDDANKIQDAE